MQPQKYQTRCFRWIVRCRRLVRFRSGPGRVQSSRQFRLLGTLLLRLLSCIWREVEDRGLHSSWTTPYSDSNVPAVLHCRRVSFAISWNHGRGFQHATVPGWSHSARSWKRCSRCICLDCCSEWPYECRRCQVDVRHCWRNFLHHKCGCGPDNRCLQLKPRPKRSGLEIDQGEQIILPAWHLFLLRYLLLSDHIDAVSGKLQPLDSTGSNHHIRRVRGLGCYLEQKLGSN